jgi:hypothetical protein
MVPGGNTCGGRWRFHWLRPGKQPHLVQALRRYHPARHALDDSDRRRRGDKGYARIIVENAGAAVARNYGKGRSRA